ncbi:MAG: hypothetical protein WED04_07435 [Promethearchaeati archaeon SRVP18_Atabeyarchaeia-1]
MSEYCLASRCLVSKWRAEYKGQSLSTDEAVSLLRGKLNLERPEAEDIVLKLIEEHELGYYPASNDDKSGLFGSE